VPPGGSFYDLFPHNLMVGLFAPVFAFVVLALGIGVARFWRDGAPGSVAGRRRRGGARRADPAYLDGGHGEGCHNDDDRLDPRAPPRAPRHVLRLHAVFRVTSVATVYHYALRLGGALWLDVAAQAAGHGRRGDAAAGLCRPVAAAAFTGTRSMWTRARPAWTWASSRCCSSPGRQRPGAGAGARGQAAMPVLLCVHLGAVLALFATLPYGKFAHGGVPLAALLKYAVERRQPSTLRLGSIDEEHPMNSPGRLAIASMQPHCSPEEWQARIDLAACYRLVDLYGLSDMMANHISSRVPGEHGAFLINPYGMMYEEITASCLIKVDLAGTSSPSRTSARSTTASTAPAT
jgi:hypothetical protein